jgi:acyl-CoA thioester hydrolase
MPAILEWTHTVVEHDLDGLGHANNISYLKWMQAAALAHSAAQGWPVEAYAALGCGWVVRSHFIEYLVPALLGDTIVVRTWVADLKKVTSLRKFLIVKAGRGDVLARAETNWAFVDYRTGSPKRIPPEVARAFEIVEMPGG